MQPSHPRIGKLQHNKMGLLLLKSTTFRSWAGPLCHHMPNEGFLSVDPLCAGKYIGFLNPFTPKPIFDICCLKVKICIFCYKNT